MLDVEREPRHVIEHVLVVPPLMERHEWREKVRVVDASVLVHWLESADEFEEEECFGKKHGFGHIWDHAKLLAGDPHKCTIVGFWRYLGIKGEYDFDGARAGHELILHHAPAVMSLTQWREQGGGANGPVFFLRDSLGSGFWKLCGVDALFGFEECL